MSISGVLESAVCESDLNGRIIATLEIRSRFLGRRQVSKLELMNSGGQINIKNAVAIVKALKWDGDLMDISQCQGRHVNGKLLPA